jgi:DNA-binding XRE family transcriptional regulator
MGFTMSFIPDNLAPMDVFDGRQLAAARALAGLTVRELAQAAGVTKGTVNRIEVAELVHVAAKLRHGHLGRDVFCKITDALARYGVRARVRGQQPRSRCALGVATSSAIMRPFGSNSASKPPMLRAPCHLKSRTVDSPAASVCQLAASGKKFFCSVADLSRLERVVSLHRRLTAP